MTVAGEHPTASAQPGGANTARITLAGWWRRVGATIVDGIVVSAIAALLASLLNNDNATRIGSEEFVALVYTVLLLGSLGRTVGTWSVSTRVVRVNRATRIGYTRAFFRWFVQQLLTATVIGGILDVLWPLWDPHNQTLHDKAVGTLVVRR